MVHIIDCGKVAQTWSVNIGQLAPGHIRLGAFWYLGDVVRAQTISRRGSSSVNLDSHFHLIVHCALLGRKVAKWG